MSDPNLHTTWDGLLEYRWDFEEGDGAWDTTFHQAHQSAGVPQRVDAEGGQTIVCEVRDRFGAAAIASHRVVHEPPPPGGDDPPTSAAMNCEARREH